MLALPWKVGPHESSVVRTGIACSQQVEADAQSLQKDRTGPYTVGPTLHWVTGHWWA